MKKIGRKVKNFSDQIWLLNRDRILAEGIKAKFEQNKNLLDQLLATGSRTLVEASPYDIIYGVGLSEKNDQILDKTNWKGTNLLGQKLVNVRLKLRDKFSTR
jgi:ribA/ribD-fused uncharacterized protein